MATRLEKTRPKTGVPRAESVANGCGNSRSRAAACANWPDIRIQPLSAPKQETIATTAMRLPAHPPQRPARHPRTEHWNWRATGWDHPHHRRGAENIEGGRNPRTPQGRAGDGLFRVPDVVGRNGRAFETQERPHSQCGARVDSEGHRLDRHTGGEHVRIEVEDSPQGKHQERGGLQNHGDQLHPTRGAHAYYVYPREQPYGGERDARACLPAGAGDGRGLGG